MANPKVQPLGDRVLVQAIEEKEQIRGGIVIPDAAKEKPQLSVPANSMMTVPAPVLT